MPGLGTEEGDLSDMDLLFPVKLVLVTRQNFEERKLLYLSLGNHGCQIFRQGSRNRVISVGQLNLKAERDT